MANTKVRGPPLPQGGGGKVPWQEILRTPIELYNTSPAPQRSLPLLGAAVKADADLFVPKAKKVVLLGASESGKTTIFTQTQRLESPYAPGKAAADAVRLALALHMKRVLPEDQARAIELDDEWPEWRPELGDVLRKFVATSKANSDFKKLCTSTLGGLLGELDRILGPDFVPTDRDQMLALQPTSGIVQIMYKKQSANLTVVDVGGRVAQRRKWSMCLTDATGVVLVVSVGELDRQTRFLRAPDFTTHTTVLQDALSITEDLATRVVRHLPLFVIFNKFDVLQDRLSGGLPIKTLLPDYAGDDTPLHMLTYLKLLFTKAAKGSNADLHFHVCSALNPKEVARVWQEITGHLPR